MTIGINPKLMLSPPWRTSVTNKEAFDFAQARKGVQARNTFYCAKPCELSSLSETKWSRNAIYSFGFRLCSIEKPRVCSEAESAVPNRHDGGFIMVLLKKVFAILALQGLPQ